MNLPVVILSADGRLNDLARKMGVTKAVRKPFDPFELAQLLRTEIQQAADPIKAPGALNPTA